MPEENRKPIILAVVVAVVVVLVFVFGVGFGGANRLADGSWRKAFSGFDTSTPLLAADLIPAAGECVVTDEAIVVPSACSFTVVAFGGTFDLGAITKKASVTFVTPTAVLTVRMDIEGTSVAQEVERDKPLELTVGRSGGTLELSCVGLDACVLEFRS